MTDVFLVSALRTAIGSFGVALKDQKPGELAGLVTRAVIDRAGLDPALVGNLVLGNVVHTGPRDAYAARIAALGAGLAEETPAHTVTACAAPASRRLSRPPSRLPWATAKLPSAPVRKC